MGRLWEIRDRYEPDYADYRMGRRETSGYRYGRKESDDYERGFDDGCKHGYDKAMEEIEMSGNRYGERRRY